MDAGRGANLDFRFHRGLVQHLAAPRHIGDGFAEAIMSRPGAFLQHNCAAGRELGDCPLPSVVVVVVVVSETCAHANGAATANAILSITFFIPA
jgi:hypothetical protein